MRHISYILAAASLIISFSCKREPMPEDDALTSIVTPSIGTLPTITSSSSEGNNADGSSLAIIEIKEASAIATKDGNPCPNFQKSSITSSNLEITFSPVGDYANPGINFARSFCTVTGKVKVPQGFVIQPSITSSEFNLDLYLSSADRYLSYLTLKVFDSDEVSFRRYMARTEGPIEGRTKGLLELKSEGVAACDKVSNQDRELIFSIDISIQFYSSGLGDTPSGGEIIDIPKIAFQAKKC